MRASLVALVAALFGIQPAHAVCTTATMAQDYREADVVVRARVVAGMEIADDEMTPAFKAKWGDYSPVTLHRLKVLDVYKGRPGPRINLFEEVSSGRYGVDLGGEYLLFLTYYRPFPGRGSEVRGAMYVKYTCGQTEPWSAIKPKKLQQLRIISGRP